MPTDCYAFIDGGYLRSKFYEFMFKRFGEVPDIDLAELLAMCKAERALWYDCLDDSTPSQPDERAIWNRRQIETARVAHMFRLRTGTLSRSGRKKPPLQQKEIDVLLAVDLLSHSHARNMRDAALILGDLDFRPAIEEAGHQGVMIHLFYDTTGIAQELLDSVDSRVPFSMTRYLSIAERSFQHSHPVPWTIPIDQASSEIRNGALLAEGTVNYKPVKLRQRVSDSNLWSFFAGLEDPSDPESELIYGFRKPDHEFILSKYLPRMLGGGISWTFTDTPEIRIV